MRNQFVLATAAAAAFSACIYGRPPLLIAEPVGPDPALIHAVHMGPGRLVVYTDRAAPSPGFRNKPPHRGYDILDVEGKRIRSVPNARSDLDSEPEEVELPAGTYRIRGPGFALLEVEVTVRVAPGLRTDVHLDREWDAPASAPRRTLVASPEGAAIGWNARAATTLGLEGQLRYEGSAIVGLFVREARSAYPKATITVDESSSAGEGVTAPLGTADLGGVARNLDNVPAGVECAVIGYDPLAVFVRSDSPLPTALTTEALAKIFSGGLTDAREIGGTAGPITPIIGPPDSDVAHFFRDKVMAGRAYAPDAVRSTHQEIPERVALSGSMIGVASAALISGDGRFRVLALDGQVPDRENSRYPLTRPLTLCARTSSAEAVRFERWAAAAEGQEIVTRHFGGIRRAP